MTTDELLKWLPRNAWGEVVSLRVMLAPYGGVGDWEELDCSGIRWLGDEPVMTLIVRPKDG